MDLRTKIEIARMERATPYASKKNILFLLRTSCGASYDKLNSEAKGMFERAAKATEQAYKMGVSDGKAGKPLTIEIDERMEKKLEAGSELTQAICDLLVQAYTSGHNLGRSERIAFCEEVSS